LTFGVRLPGQPPGAVRRVPRHGRPGFLPLAGDASLSIEVSPGIEINRLTDIALKTTSVKPGMQIIERYYGMLEVHSPSLAEVRAAGAAILAEVGVAETDRIKPRVLSSQIIRRIDDHQAQLINRTRHGQMLIPGQTLYVLELEPAAYAALAANEAEKAAHINILEVRAFGSMGRIYWAGRNATSTSAGGPRWRRSRGSKDAKRNHSRTGSRKENGSMTDALGMIEARGFAAVVEAADAMVKAAKGRAGQLREDGRRVRDSGRARRRRSREGGRRSRRPERRQGRREVVASHVIARPHVNVDLVLPLGRLDEAKAESRKGLGGRAGRAGSTPARRSPGRWWKMLLGRVDRDPGGEPQGAAHGRLGAPGRAPAWTRRTTRQAATSWRPTRWGRASASGALRTGSSARQTETTRDRPCDAVIMAIVDTWEIGGRRSTASSGDRP